jgi:hypothetical protein
MHAIGLANMPIMHIYACLPLYRTGLYAYILGDSHMLGLCAYKLAPPPLIAWYGNCEAFGLEKSLLPGHWGGRGWGRIVEGYSEGLYLLGTQARILGLINAKAVNEVTHLRK